MRPETSALTPARAILYGTIVVGVLDIADAFIFFAIRGVAPLRILQSIASGLLGRSAFQGGVHTAALGALLPFFIACCIVATCVAIGSRVRAVGRHPVVIGALYGVSVYAVMNFVVLPLSAAASGRPTLPVFVNGVLIHIFGVGIPSALFARAAFPSHTEAPAA